MNMVFHCGEIFTNITAMKLEIPFDFSKGVEGMYQFHSLLT